MNTKTEIEVGEEVFPMHCSRRLPELPAGSVGVVKTIQGVVAEIEFKIPNEPKICAGCGKRGGFSKVAGTGEIVHMIPGCEHAHGFQKVLRYIPVDMLETRQVRDHRSKVAWEQELKILRRGLEEHMATGRANGWTEE